MYFNVHAVLDTTADRVFTVPRHLPRLSLLSLPHDLAKKRPIGVNPSFDALSYGDERGGEGGYGISVEKRGATGGTIVLPRVWFSSLGNPGLEIRLLMWVC